MLPRVIVCVLLFTGFPATSLGAAPVDLEVATERGLQITAPREWLQLLTEAGVDHVRIRSATRGEEPLLENRGTDDRPRYHVVGILTARQQLLLPGGAFGRSDRAKLADYFARLAADGGEGVVAPRGRFGLTESQFRAIHEDLSKPIGFATKELTVQEFVDRLASRFKHEVQFDRSATRAMADRQPIGDELETLTTGSGLAIALRKDGLGLQPYKPRGEPVVFRIASLPPADDETGDESASKSWPIGWESEARPRELAPMLFEYVNARIAGYSLREALQILEPRVKVPLFLDHAALARHDIDADALQVEFPSQRTYYKRVLDRMLFQARLRGELRVDEAGTVFYWISR